MQESGPEGEVQIHPEFAIGLSLIIYLIFIFTTIHKMQQEDVY